MPIMGSESLSTQAETLDNDTYLDWLEREFARDMATHILREQFAGRIEEDDPQVADDQAEDVAEPEFDEELIAEIARDYTIGPNTRTAISAVRDAGLKDNQLLRVVTKMWNRAEEIWGDEAVFEFFPFTDETEEIETAVGTIEIPKGWDAKTDDEKQEIYERNAFVPVAEEADVETTAEFAREVIANYDDLVEQAANFIIAHDIQSLLQTKALRIETNHSAQITPIVAQHIFIAGFHRAHERDISRDTTLIVGIRPLLSHHRDDPLPAHVMLQNVGNHAVVLPDSKNGNVPGAENLRSTINGYATKRWHRLGQTPGQIQVQNVFGTNDTAEGKPGKLATPRVVRHAGTTKRQDVVAMALTRPDENNMHGMAMRLHSHVPKTVRTLSGARVVKDLYGDLFGEALMSQRQAAAEKTEQVPTQAEPDPYTE